MIWTAGIILSEQATSTSVALQMKKSERSRVFCKGILPLTRLSSLMEPQVRRRIIPRHGLSPDEYDGRIHYVREILITLDYMENNSVTILVIRGLENHSGRTGLVSSLSLFLGLRADLTVGYRL